ncbi:Valine--tRNA ligase [compost metagenome]
MEVINSVEYTLRHILETSLKLLHPFMPFITEEIWMNIEKENENLLMVTAWPKKN